MGTPETRLEDSASEETLTADLARFVTMANVVWNIRRWSEKKYGEQNVSAAFVAHMRERSKVRARRALSADAEQLLRVAWQTELAGRVPAAFDVPVLRRVAALTLPVQAYYSVFNALRAFTRVRGSPIDSHTSMHKDFAENLLQDFPAPWCVSLAGNSDELGECVVSPSGFVDPQGVNLTQRAHEAEVYIFGALRMTRKWKWETSRERWLKETKRTPLGGRYKRLPKGRGLELMTALRPTSLFDFLYELRCRAHYQTADEYAADFSDDIMDRFHHGLTFLAHTGLLLAEYQIVTYVGFDGFKDAAERWAKTPRALGTWATESLDERVTAIEAYG